MPKLPKNAVKTVDDAEITNISYDPIEPGRYLARLLEVNVRENTDKYDQTMWSATFDNLHSLTNGEPVSGLQWFNLTVPSGSNKVHPAYENSPQKWATYQNLTAGRMKSFFEAMGYTVDSDTDEMIGEYAILTVAIRTIQKGARQGQLTNEVTGIASMEDAGVTLEDFGIPDTESAF